MGRAGKSQLTRPYDLKQAKPSHRGREDLHDEKVGEKELVH
jgi:hypothetical protein